MKTKAEVITKIKEMQQECRSCYIDDYSCIARFCGWLEALDWMLESNRKVKDENKS